MQFRKKNGITRLTDCYQRPPLKASRALYVDDRQRATVYLMESSGGMVAGDRNEYSVHVHPQGNVKLIQQSATKIYPSLDELTSNQHISVCLDQGACLEWRPETIIPFENARFRGDTTIQLQPDSTLLWGEILSPGRVKRNECFHYKDFSSRFQIWLDGRCLAYDSLRFLPETMPLNQIGLLEDSLYIGSLWFVSPQTQFIDSKALQDELNDVENIKAGITSLDEKGIHIRWLTSDLLLLKKEMDKMWETFR